MNKHLYLFCILAVASVAVAVKSPDVKRVAKRLETLQAEPVPTIATPARVDGKSVPRFQQKSKESVRRDCPSGTRKVPTVMPEYKPEAQPLNPISPQDLNNAVKGAISLTLSPIQAVALTAVSLTGSLLTTSTGGAEAIGAASTASTDTAAAGGTGGTASDSGTGGSATGAATGSEASCPLSPEELASLPADLYGHADFSNTINSAQGDINEQEDIQSKSDANGGYDYQKLLNSADQLLSDAEPFLKGDEFSSTGASSHSTTASR